ncbi:uncharacterized protein [Alexandromys fortis]|uniref:uncharacterized protein isoform X1 n=1 Tax=Alexandromys fortis TaxID=100897 RepID=UPI002152485F|nr:uncharacterized protein LOC126508688 isoform X1 [Microtus fortis]
MPGKWSRSPCLILSPPQAGYQRSQQGPGQSPAFHSCDFCLTPWAYFSTQTLAGASRTLKFFFSEAFMGQHFQEVELDKGDPQPGDLFLFRLQSPKAQWLGAHVGVYCGHGEIIHFEGRTSSSSAGLQTLLGYCEGVVCKQGHRALQRSRRLWRVLRRRRHIDPEELERRVREAMDSDPPPYHPTSSNCVHFALNLLGMDSMPMDLDLTMD